MLNEGSIKDLIRQNMFSDIPSVIEQNKIIGMISFDQSLLSLYDFGLIDAEQVIKESDNPSDIAFKIKQRDLNKVNKDGDGVNSNFVDIDTSAFEVSKET